MISTTGIGGTPQILLYKYLPPDRIDALNRARIRFTQPDQLNDPFESRPVMVAIRKMLRSRLITESPTGSAEQIEGLVDKFIDGFFLFRQRRFIIILW